MRVVTIYENTSLYRDKFVIQGYQFGSGEKKICVVGNTRGNEYQQLYVCSRLVEQLKQVESHALLTSGFEILVIPSCNPYSLNIEKRFWPIDNTDINRMFPGYTEGETTQRIAAAIFEKIKDYEFGIQLASFYMPGDFMPHVLIMKTELDYVDLATQFGMPYVVVRPPRPYDTTTLNYNWQVWKTRAFSLYTTTTDHLDNESALRGVSAILRFMSAQKLLYLRQHNGFISDILDESRDMAFIRTPFAGFFIPKTKVEQEVQKGELLAEIHSPMDGSMLDRITAPCNGIVFFMHSKPLIYSHTAAVKLIKLHGES